MVFFERKEPLVCKVVKIPTALIDPNPAQPRRNFDREAIIELAQSIKENGLLTPISVRKTEQRYQLIAGERRLKAFKLLNEKEIPAIIEQADDRRSTILAIIENLQRRDLDFYEEAAAIKQLILNCDITQQQAAAKLGLSQSAVANKLRILRLPEDILSAMAKAGASERHARALLPLAQDDRLASVVQRVMEQQLTVSQTEKLVASITEQKKSSGRGEKILIIKDLRIFNTAIVRAVDMMKQAGIDAVSNKTEDDRQIIYTVVIPKKKSDQPPAKEAF